MRKSILGVGINDSECSVYKFKTVDGKRVLISVCPYYQRWKDMLTRCYNPRFAKKNKSYFGCTVCDDWLYFSNFKAWMELQDWNGKHLDKDIINQGNKVYSPENCAFVLYSTNQFIVNTNKKFGDLPIGASVNSRTGKYCAYIGVKGKKVFLGDFDTAEEASMAWRLEKFRLAVEISKKESDNRVVAAIVDRFAI
ncbi:hypothetical protein [Pseudoalteromonas phage Pq0]|uniref:HNH endonuclease n=1 Tax=Pseudoalteromonas phage Pq0 TaxID=1667322 RepID=UPI0006563DE2|nr:HNH endonuclease [Pseudoalteromonas phage Pq0]AKN44305.1 hypothetical protein [Pseudoalteromonas phage Pq0]